MIIGEGQEKVKEEPDLDSLQLCVLVRIMKVYRTVSNLVRSWISILFTEFVLINSYQTAKSRTETAL